MSHTTTVKMKISDKVALREAAEKLGVKFEEDKDFKMFDGKQVRGDLVYLPGWKYPAVIDSSGTIHMDTYNGSWGNPKELDRFKQRYAICASDRQAQTEGRPPADQSVQGDLITCRWAGDGFNIVGKFPLSGDATFDVEGCVGQTCKNVTAGMINALGDATMTMEKPEAYTEVQKLREDA